MDKSFQLFAGLPGGSRHKAGMTENGMRPLGLIAGASIHVGISGTSPPRAD